MERPCPAYFNGVKYNTTRECPGPSAPACRDAGLGSGEGSGPSVGQVLRAADPSDRWR